MAFPPTPLCEIARKYGCEKGGLGYPFPVARATYNPYHDYTPVYWDMFGFWAAEAKYVLEIGINEGRSLRMWRDFFGNATIIGLDNRPETLIKEDRIWTFLADQGDAETLRGAVPSVKYDVIIDDGSHLYKDQKVSFDTLREFLQPHGLYIIEDHYEGEKYMDAPEGWSKAQNQTGPGNNLLQVFWRGGRYPFMSEIKR